MEESRGEILWRYFGHRELRPGQEEVVERVMAGVNTLAVLPTGAGKSLCYQLPALLMDGLAVVISPLIALMRDQVQGLEERGIAVRRLDSSLSPDEREEVLEEIRREKLKLLYLSPEGVSEPDMVKLLRHTRVSMVAVDEAHCISEWGNSFRSSYIRLPRVIRSIKPEMVLALTATASVETARSIRSSFKILKRNQVQTSFYRENLSYRVVACSGREKLALLLRELRSADRVPAVVYCLRRGDAEEVAAFLNANKFSARAYHAGMPVDVRGSVQDGFVKGEFPVICATIAFGMGVDMPNIRTVIHYQPPKSPEGWIQESGRAGRDGEPSHCVVLLNANDRFLLENVIEARVPGEGAIRAIVQHIFSQGKTAIVSKYNLSTLNDVSKELLDVMLARLEIAGWIKPTGGSWMWCHVSQLRWDGDARDRILRGFGKSDRERFSKVLDARERVSLLDLSEGSVAKLNRLIRMLRELEAAGDVRLKFSHSLVHYQIKRHPDHLFDLSKELTRVVKDYADVELAKVDSVFKIAASRRCVTNALIHYFGEKMSTRCGHCSACQANICADELPYDTPEEVSVDEMQIIQNLLEKRRPALATPARLARFLCGVYSPAMMRYRLYAHEQFGLLQRMPFADVLAICRVASGRE